MRLLDLDADGVTHGPFEHTVDRSWRPHCVETFYRLLIDASPTPPDPSATEDR